MFEINVTYFLTKFHQQLSLESHYLISVNKTYKRSSNLISIIDFVFLAPPPLLSRPRSVNFKNLYPRNSWVHLHDKNTKLNGDDYLPYQVVFLSKYSINESCKRFFLILYFSCKLDQIRKLKKKRVSSVGTLTSILSNLGQLIRFF